MKNKRNEVDPSYFCTEDSQEIENNSEEKEEFYEKGGKVDLPIKEVHLTNEDILVLPGEKGESDVHVDIGSARKIVKDLHNNYAEYEIKNLSGESKKQFLTLHEVIEALRGTQAYEYIRDMIRSEFGCEQDHRFKMGTVGSYFCECKSENNFPGNRSCSLGCLLGLKSIGCDTDYPCEYTCISYNGDGNYSTIYKADGVKQAYLFVNDKFKFEGLYPGEYKYFSKIGVEEVKIVKHSDGLSYQEITSDFIPVRNLILKNSKIDVAEDPEEITVDITIIIILILILIIAGAGGWYYYKKT